MKAGFLGIAAAVMVVVVFGGQTQADAFGYGHLVRVVYDQATSGTEGPSTWETWPRS